MDSSETFSDRLVGLLNATACSTALGVASRTGLLKALLGTHKDPATAANLAAKAGLSVRYVEEILAVLVCGDIVVLELGKGGGEMEEEEPTFSLPSERGDALSGFGMYFEELPLLCSCAFPQVCEAAKDGSGITSGHYTEFGAWMGKLADNKHAEQLTSKFLPALMEGKVVEALRKGGAEVLDLGCGRGTAARLIAAEFPSANVTGVDIDEASIDAARAHSDAANHHNLKYVVGDASILADPLRSNDTSAAIKGGGYDLILSFDAMHDLTDPLGAMQTARTLLKPVSGVFAMVDIRAETGLPGNLKHGMAAFLYAVSLMHCMPQGLNCDASGKQGPGLGMMWGRGKAMAMLKEAGFANVDIVELEFDNFSDVYLARV